MSSLKPAVVLNPWTILASVLVLVTIGAGAVIWARYEPGRPIAISLEPETPLQGQIYVGGVVNNPGVYPLKDGDTIDNILGAAGGVKGGTAPETLELLVDDSAARNSPQKVDINRAEDWLLAALPGIGEGRAQAIIEYRTKNGPFRSIEELTKVPGIGENTLEKLRLLITVND